MMTQNAPETGIPPVVVPTKTPLALRKKIRDILLEMKNEPAGRAIPGKALVDRLSLVNNSNDDNSCHKRKQAEDAGYQVIR